MNGRRGGFAVELGPSCSEGGMAEGGAKRGLKKPSAKALGGLLPIVPSGGQCASRLFWWSCRWHDHHRCWQTGGQRVDQPVGRIGDQSWPAAFLQGTLAERVVSSRMSVKPATASKAASRHAVTKRGDESGQAGPMDPEVDPLFHRVHHDGNNRCQDERSQERPGDL